MDHRASKTGGQSARSANRATVATANSKTSGSSVAPQAPKAPSRSATSSRSVHPGRELPAPTPLLLPPLSSNDAPQAGARSASQPPSRKAPSSKAPPPPQRRRAAAKAAAPVIPASPAIQERPRRQVHTAQDAHPKWGHESDAQWAEQLSSPDHAAPTPSESPAPHARASSSERAASDRPPHDGADLFDLKSEISALRPRPSELPPAPDAAVEHLPSERAGRSKQPYRTKTPSDLSVLFQASAVNSPVAKRAEAGPRPLVQPGSRGYVPKSPLEFLPPPPPPTRRVPAAELGDDDELPTQARHPASVPPVGHVAAHRSALIPPPAPPAPAVAAHASARLPSSMPPAGFSGALPQLPPPPALPFGFTASGHTSNPAPKASATYQTWDDQEWTGAQSPDWRVPDVRPRHAAAEAAYSPVPPDTASPFAAHTQYRDSSTPDSSRTGAHPMYEQASPYQGAESVRPTAWSVPPSSGGFLPSGWLPVAGASVMGAALSAGAFMLPQRGQLLVDVSNQSWASLGNVQVFVDGELACTQSPCAVKLDASTHRVKAVAPGYQPSQEESVLITDDSVTLHKIQLGASADTGIDVQTSIPNLQLYVDGRRVGSLPRKVMGLPPGEHTVVVSGGEHFTSEERRVIVEPNQILAISDLVPKLKAGSLEVNAGAHTDGASVQLDGKSITLPYRAHLTPGKEYRLSAQREGFEAFEKTFTVDANNPSAAFNVVLNPLRSDAASPRSSNDDTARRVTRERDWGQTTRAQTVAKILDEAPSDVVAPSKETQASSNDALDAAMRQSVGLPADASAPTETKATGKGFLNIVTTPSAMVLIDGKPMGKTPRRVAVTPGTHSVVLVHANGRKRTSVDVDAGGTKTIKASF